MVDTLKYVAIFDFLKFQATDFPEGAIIERPKNFRPGEYMNVVMVNQTTLDHMRKEGITFNPFLGRF